MALYKYLVISTATEGNEARFNDWYTNQHVPDVLRVPGFVGAQRFSITGDSNLPGRYVAIYDMETDNPEETLKELQSRAGTPAMMLSDSLDMTTVSAGVLVPLTDRVKA